MNKNNHIKELESAITRIANEPTKNWIHKISKSIKVKKIKRKIEDLKKRHHGN
jgi:hypothetical protein